MIVDLHDCMEGIPCLSPECKTKLHPKVLAIHGKLVQSFYLALHRVDRKFSIHFYTQL